jgi:hypothetical protein
MIPPDQLAVAIDRLASVLEELGVSLDAAVRDGEPELEAVIVDLAEKLRFVETLVSEIRKPTQGRLFD